MNTTRRAVLATLVLLLVGASLLPGRAHAATTPPPRWLRLTTQPVLPRATFTFDGAQYTTGSDGSVLIMTTDLTNVEQRLSFNSIVDAPRTSAHFDHFVSLPEHNLLRQVIAVFDMSRYVHVVTVPALPAATFVLDGVAHTTGADGTATIDTTNLINIAQRLAFKSVVTDRATAAQFLRFDSQPQQGYWRDVLAVFGVSRAVQFSFAGPDGGAVPTGRVASMTIRSSTGQERKLTTSMLRHPVMLPAIHVLSASELHAQQHVRYTVQSVMVDGSNTVIASQHEFFPADTTAVRVDAMFFPLRITVHDALFGYASGKAVVLQRPDKTESRYRLSKGTVTLTGVARGDYQIRVLGAGYAGWRPVVVSRSQTIDLSPVSVLDVAAVAAGILIVAGGLLFLGYRRRARRRRRSGSGPGRTGREGGDSLPGPPDSGHDDLTRTPEPVG
jgi:hypothetical protein